MGRMQRQESVGDQPLRSMGAASRGASTNANTNAASSTRESTTSNASNDTKVTSNTKATSSHRPPPVRIGAIAEESADDSALRKQQDALRHYEHRDQRLLREQEDELAKIVGRELREQEEKPAKHRHPSDDRDALLLRKQAASLTDLTGSMRGECPLKPEDLTLSPDGLSTEAPESVGDASLTDVKRAEAIAALGCKAPGAYEHAPGQKKGTRLSLTGLNLSSTSLGLGSSTASFGAFSDGEDGVPEPPASSQESQQELAIKLEHAVANGNMNASYGEYIRCSSDHTASLTDMNLSSNQSSAFMVFGDDDIEAQPGALPRDDPPSNAPQPFSPLPPDLQRGLNQIPTSSLVQAHTVEDEPELITIHAKPLSRWTPQRISALVLALLVLIAIVVVASVTATAQNNLPTTLSPTPQPTLPPEVRLATIAEAVGYRFNESASDNTTTTITNPQYQALQWLAGTDALRVPEDKTDHLRQRYALAVLYFATRTEETNWTNTYEFLMPTHECAWSGALVCEGDNVVTGIDLRNNGLEGRLPAEIELLSALKSLVLDDNSLYGSLPTNLPLQLEKLDLWNNNLDGTIAGSLLASMTHLESLRVGENALTGTIPSQIGSLTQLTALSLESNRLTGSIPQHVWNLTRMRDFRIGQQSLTGYLSPNIGLWTNTTVFHANKMNGLMGTIPSQMGLLTQLTNFKLSQNHLRGTLPSQLGNLHQVSLLAISRNGISGTIPSQFGKLSNAEQIYLQNTWMTGDFTPVCRVQEEGGLPLLKTFNADLEEVNCTCCTCCEY